MSVDLVDEVSENPYESPRATGEYVRNYLTVWEELIYPGGIVYSGYLYNRYLSETSNRESFDSNFWRDLPLCMLVEGFKLYMQTVGIIGIYYFFS
ncbi:hypothetical protein GF386_05720 [Candidatus Pacearchaeota archaeon]|nr:hypothetical protein [Candidatus Pacearchaeota archaeon]MBD3283592.1 hypothetical protein [Candidatus Pacearchaeota archaeon]